MPNRSNILFVMTDQHRGDVIGADPECPTDDDGWPLIHTPDLNSIVTNGALFSSAYTPIPSCVPARRCLWTGQTQATCDSAYWHNREWDFEHSLPHTLRNAGYQTQLVGKTHSQPPGNHLGFEGIDWYVGTTSNDYAEWLEQRSGGEYNEMSHGLGGNSWDPRPSHLNEHEYPTNWTTNRAIDFLENQDPTRPFFLTVSYLRPHQPFDPPPVYWNMYIDRTLPDPYMGDWVHELHEEHIPEYPDLDTWIADLPPTIIHRARTGYYGLITHIDHQLNRLIRALGSAGELDDTLIVFTSDHGEMLGDHHHWRKTFPYEGSARIPFLVSLPGETEYGTGRVIDRPVGLEDVMPTVLDGVSVDIPDTVEGQSVFQLFENDARNDWREYYHGEHGPIYTKENATQYLVGDGMKYIWNPVTSNELLFDLEADPGETNDLTADPDYKAVYETWRSRLITQLASRPEGFSDGEALHCVAPDSWG